MHCKQCKAEVPPAWVNAIQKNECPGCGGPIMDQKTQDLLAGLTEAMTQMKDDPVGVAGWIISNYRLEKYGEYGPTEFHHKNGKRQDRQTQPGEQPDPNDRRSLFFKNADAPDHFEARAKAEELKAKVGKGRKVQSGEAVEVDIFDGETDDLPIINPLLANRQVELDDDDIDAIAARLVAQKMGQ